MIFAKRCTGDIIAETTLASASSALILIFLCNVSIPCPARAWTPQPPTVHFLICLDPTLRSMYHRVTRAFRRVGPRNQVQAARPTALLFHSHSASFIHGNGQGVHSDTKIVPLACPGIRLSIAWPSNPSLMAIGSLMSLADLEGIFQNSSSLDLGRIDELLIT